MVQKTSRKSLWTYIYVSLLFIAALIIIAGNSPRDIYPVVIAASVFIFACGLLYLLSARVIFAVGTSSLLVILLQFCNQLKVHYYKDQLLFSDFYLMADPSNASTLLHYPSAGIAVAAMITLLILTIIISWRTAPRRRGMLAPLIALGVMLGSASLLSHSVLKNQRNWVTMLPGGTGVLSNLALSGIQTQYDAPTFPQATSLEFASRAAALNNKTAASASVKPDIVLLLQESTVDPRLYKVPDPKLLPHFSMFEQDSKVKAHTPMRVQTFGGGTWLSEFAVLTGMRSDDFGALKSSVFYSAIDHVNDSLFKQMKNNGYYTVVLTPFNKSAYNAGHAYTMMGVDKIIQPQELGYPGDLSDNLWHITTGDVLGYVKKILAGHTDKPVFVYALTMYEHGPYDAGHSDDYQLASVVKNEDSAGKFSHYVEKIKNSETALADFFQFVDRRQRPTMFMYFGDHQPGIGWENGYATAQKKPSLLTQFSLRDNYNAPPVADLGSITDIAFLGGMLLEQAQLKVSPFYQANIDMRHLCQGRLNDCPDTTLFNSYRHYVYDELQAASKP
ncbi:Phosphoglycerol transferase and related proteins, alkaline phosphatase superfamily [Cedecea neteri]|uniref:Phosphoethanolamine transferase n=1 Tax=Cedecea neteri TaxID=158822 RepID=A0A291E4P4_9ENTR|nr:LTA synthase family protein [Cedecea neteri]ATF95017.1 phosphoethanolamine transferase [Cedecea neteri]SQA98688.1 Phosphoglycerol transferase and related proteins, alkaline phosphatase superfamily [Cedecea neteri]